jgi:hypothetical protein
MISLVRNYECEGKTNELVKFFFLNGDAIVIAEGLAVIEFGCDW